MNTNGVNAGVNAASTQAMLCTAVVELQRKLSDLTKAMATQTRKHQQRAREMVARISSLEGTVRLLQLAQTTASFGDEALTTPAAVAAAPTTVDAPLRRRKRSETEEEEEDSQSTPPRAPKKKRRTGSATKVSF